MTITSESEVDTSDEPIEKDEEDNESDYEIPLAQREIITQPSDPTISSLCEKIDREKIIVRGDFQRKYVWENKPIIKSKLIESVLLRVPIPVIYTAEDEKTGKELVIDGQQRLVTFHGFKNNKFTLKGLTILSELNGYKFSDLSDSTDEIIIKISSKLGDLQDRFCDCPIRVIKILKKSHPDIKFEIFERLNRGSVKLNDQELRNCIYRGNFNELLKELAKNPDFMRLQGLNDIHRRMLDVERILRFFAFCDTSERNYIAPLKKFLNDYMKEKQNMEADELERKKNLFKKSVELCQTVFGNIAYKRVFPGVVDNKNGYVQDSINQGIMDIQMYGFMEYEKRDIVPKAQMICEAYLDLVTSNSRFIETIEIGTYGTNQVKYRTETWINKLRETIGLPSNDPRNFTYADKKLLFDSNDVCELCKNKITYIEDAHVDHIERYSEGGVTKIRNGRLTHRYCNLHRN